VNMLGDFRMCVSFHKFFSSIKIMHAKEGQHNSPIYITRKKQEIQ
jgi:hypothetical protein